MQNQNILGRLREESDWTSLYTSWKNANKEDPRAKFLYFLEMHKKENTSDILAYAIFHIDKHNKFLEVITFCIFFYLLDFFVKNQ